MKRTLIGLASACLALSLTSCASASPPSLEVETEYITRIVEVRPQMTVDQEQAPATCPAILPVNNAVLSADYLACAVIASDNGGQVESLQSLILGRDPSPPERAAPD